MKDSPTRGPGRSRGLVVYVHGYLDDAGVWGAALRRIRDGELSGWRHIAPSIDGGSAALRSDDRGAVLEILRDQVLDVVRREGGAGPVVLVGHSMGGQVVELAAAECPDLVDGLVLVVPAPLGGTALGEQQMSFLMSRTGLRDAEAIAAGKLRLAVSLERDALDALVAATLATPPERARATLRAWTSGHPLGDGPSSFPGPVLLVTTNDTFFTAERLEREVEARFASVRTVHVPEAGHWPQLEAPDVVVAALTGFVAREVAASGRTADV